MSLRPRTGPRTRRRDYEPFSASELPPRRGTFSESGVGRLQAQGGSSAGQTGPSVSLNDIFQKCEAIAATVSKMDERLKKIEEKQTKTAIELREVKETIKVHHKKTFVVRGSPFEIPIKREMAKLFCLNLKRKPAEKDIQDSVVKILGQEARDKYKFEILLTFAKSKLTEFRTDERRKVLGMAPYNKLCTLNSNELADNILHSMHADEVDTTTYYRHLVLLRKFARGAPNIPLNFYVKFREWVDGNGYGQLTEDEWEDVVQQDGQVQYNELPVEQIEEELISNLNEEYEL